MGREYVQGDEAAIVSEMIREMEGQLDRLYGGGQKMLRQIHTKMHGCVKAKFLILDDLPNELRVGLFSKPASYPAWVRFSNSSTIPKPDAKKDIRGIAIKLMNVPGEKLLNEKRHLKTHDFLMMSSETFFARDLVFFRKTMRAVTSKNKLKLLAYFLNPLHWPMVARLLRSNIKCDHPFEISYWSTQPYQYGAPEKAVKYFLQPDENNKLLYVEKKDENYLQQNMARTLRFGTVKFNFYIQFQEDAETMPIEDPTVPWKSPFIKVAELTIPPQVFNSNEQMRFGDNLSFHSWHCLPEHRPLGSFNRARKQVYLALSKYRHRKNGLPDQEPEAGDDFFVVPAVSEDQPHSVAM